ARPRGDAVGEPWPPFPRPTARPGRHRRPAGRPATAPRDLRLLPAPRTAVRAVLRAPAARRAPGGRGGRGSPRPAAWGPRGSPASAPPAPRPAAHRPHRLPLAEPGRPVRPAPSATIREA